jgi:hypothetical protein
MGTLHDYFIVSLRGSGLPLPQANVTLAPGCTVQYAWPEQRLVLEFIGGVGHCATESHAADQLLADLGYRVFRFTPRWLRSGDVTELLQQFLRPDEPDEQDISTLQEAA